MVTTLTGVVADHIAAVNRFDRQAMIATFVEDALVNDARREFWGLDAITAWLDKEIIGDHVTMDVLDVVHHHGEVIVQAKYDGDYDKTNLGGDLIMTSYFTLEDERIVQLIIIRNIPKQR